MRPNQVEILRATGAWWGDEKGHAKLPSDATEFDLSDHHPCKWTIDSRTGQTLRGIQYNVQFLWKTVNDAPGKKDEKEIQACATLIANWLIAQNTDVICLQELFDSDAVRVIEKMLIDKGYISTARVGGKTNEDSGGVRTFCKRDAALLVEDLGAYIYQHKVDYLRRADALADKGIKHVKVTKGGQAYHVLNTHLQAFYEDPSHQHYIEVTQAQIIELRNYIRTQRILGIIKPGEKVVINGDLNIPFNATPNDTSKEKREQWFKRAAFLLGDEGVMFETPRDKFSFDPVNNTYLQGISSEQNAKATLDLAFLFDADKTEPEETFGLCEFVRQAQLQLSQLVRKSVFPPLYNMGEENQRKITELSTAIDNLVKLMETPWPEINFIGNANVELLRKNFPELKEITDYQASTKSKLNNLCVNATPEEKAYINAVRIAYLRLDNPKKIAMFDEAIKNTANVADLKKEMGAAISFHTGIFFKPAFTESEKTIAYHYLSNLIDIKLSINDAKLAHVQLNGLKEKLQTSETTIAMMSIADLTKKLENSEIANAETFSQALIQSLPSSSPRPIK